MVGCAVACATGDDGEEGRTGRPGEGADQYELVIVDDGADTVEVEIPENPPAPSAVDTGGVVQFRPEGAYTVQVGMYADSRQAAAVVQELAASGYPAYGMARPDGRGVRVRIGYFGTRQEADRFGERFREDTGADYWVDLRANEDD